MEWINPQYADLVAALREHVEGKPVRAFLVPEEEQPEQD